MDELSANIWAGMSPGDRFVFILGMIREKFPQIAKQYDRNLCHIGQHSQCLRWLLREKIESEPVGMSNLGNWANSLEKKGLIKRDKNEDTLLSGETLVLGKPNSRIASLTAKGIERYSTLVKKNQHLSLELLPDWFLYMCLDEEISTPRESKFHHPIPVALRDFRPKSAGEFDLDECCRDQPIRNGFVQSNISNFSYSDLSRLLREERGIHFLIGGAGSGKTEILNAAANAWLMPHVAHPSMSFVRTFFSCRDYAEHLIARNTPPEDEEEFQRWCDKHNQRYPPEPEVVDDVEWEKYEQKRSRIDSEITLNELEDYIFQRYVQHLPNTTSKTKPMEMLKHAKPGFALFVDGLDEISYGYRNHILKHLNSLVERNPLHRVMIASRPVQTPEQHQPEVQTLTRLLELPVNWPSKDFSAQTTDWPVGLERTPLTWMLVQQTKDKTSDGAGEEEILDQYLDDCMEKALKRGKPPLPKKKMWDILRKTALQHCEIGVYEFCEIPGGFDDEDSVSEWNATHLWAYLHMQIIQEVPGWRVSGFEHMTVLPTTSRFSHRTVQEYLASQAFDNVEDLLKWCDRQKIQNPEWCWPVIRYAMLRLDGKKKIIQHLSDLEEDILGHLQGLINYLSGNNKQMLPIGIPENHTKLKMKIAIDSVNRRSVHEFPQIDSEESRATVDRIVDCLVLIKEHGPDEIEGKVGVDWEGSFGLEPTFLRCLTHRLLEQENRTLISRIRHEQPERIIRFWEYYTKLLWISKKPAEKESDDFVKPFEQNFMKYNWSLDEWIEPWADARVCTIADREARNDVMLETYRMNSENPVPFDGPERQMMHFLDTLDLPSFAVELTWMFGFDVPTYTFNRWLKIFRIDSHENVYSHMNYADEGFGWILTLCQEIRSNLILNDGPWPRIRHPRFKNQKLSSTVPGQPNTPGELLDLMGTPPPIVGKIIINASSSRFELADILAEAEKTNRIDLLINWLFMKPDFYIEPEKKREFERLGVSPRMFNHYRNQFLEHWCLSPYVSGELPLLKDFPWFEELWG